MANSQEVYLGDSCNDRQSEMMAETGNAYNTKLQMNESQIKDQKYENGM